MADANTTAAWSVILLCADFCTYRTLGNLIVSISPGAIWEPCFGMKYFPFVSSCKTEQASLEFWETISFIYQNLSWLWNSWKTKISATFFPCLLPFIFLTLLGLVNVEERKGRQEKTWRNQRKFSWESFCERRKTLKLSWKHPTSQHRLFKMLKLERLRVLAVEQKVGTTPDGWDNPLRGSRMEDNKDPEKYSFPTSSDLLKSFQMNKGDEHSLVYFILFILLWWLWFSRLCGGVGLGSPVWILLYKHEFVKNGGCWEGGGLGKTQRSAIILKHAGPYLCHKG